MAEAEPGSSDPEATRSPSEPGLERLEGWCARPEVLEEDGGGRAPAFGHGKDELLDEYLGEDVVYQVGPGLGDSFCAA